MCTGTSAGNTRVQTLCNHRPLDYDRGDVAVVLRASATETKLRHDLTHTHSRRSPPHLIIFVEFMLTLAPFVAALQPNGCPSWKSLATELPSAAADSPVKIDSVRQQQAPVFSKERPTLFRERHGWCPYSERVWLALETKGIEYDTVLIDNTGGGRPSYFSGSTPQMRWADGRMQGESLDLVKALDKLYPEATPLWPPEGVDMGAVNAMVSAFKGTFLDPRVRPRGRPSSSAGTATRCHATPLRLFSPGQTSSSPSTPTGPSSVARPFRRPTWHGRPFLNDTRRSCLASMTTSCLEGQTSPIWPNGSTRWRRQCPHTPAASRAMHRRGARSSPWPGTATQGACKGPLAYGRGGCD